MGRLSNGINIVVEWKDSLWRFNISQFYSTSAGCQTKSLIVIIVCYCGSAFFKPKAFDGIEKPLLLASTWDWWFLARRKNYGCRGDGIRPVGYIYMNLTIFWKFCSSNKCSLYSGIFNYKDNLFRLKYCIQSICYYVQYIPAPNVSRARIFQNYFFSFFIRFFLLL